MLRQHRHMFAFAALAVVFAAGLFVRRIEWAAPAKAAAPAVPDAAPPAPHLLTKHENETFTNQTVYISGQAFIRCKFVACTLVLRESIYHLEGCNFERCNWHVDALICWGDTALLAELRALVKLMEEAQKTQLDR